MNETRPLTIFHSPQTRSTGIVILMEELGAPYTLQVLNMKAGEQREPAYLAINPMGKVPAAKHGEALITEQVALYIYLADLFPAAALAPAPNDPLRGPYLRWLVFYGSCFEPAIVDRSLQRAPGNLAMSPYGDFDTMWATVIGQLANGPYLLGERFCAADILWGTALKWITDYKLVPTVPEVMAYAGRIAARPSVTKVAAMDQRLAAEHAAAIKT